MFFLKSILQIGNNKWGNLNMYNLYHAKMRKLYFPSCFFFHSIDCVMVNEIWGQLNFN